MCVLCTMSSDDVGLSCCDDADYCSLKRRVSGVEIPYFGDFLK